jgi:type 1 glutamine amidotransferase
MRFVADAQLPPASARRRPERDHAAEHVTRRPRALLLTRDDKHHHGIESDLGSHRVVPWLTAEGIDVTATTDHAVMSENGLRGCHLFLPWLMPQWESDLPSEALRTQAEAVADFVRTGGALFPFHGATVVPDPDSYRPYVDLLGTRFRSHPKFQEFAVHITAPEHPITSGLADFRTADELYIHEPLTPDADVLATADWEDATHPMAYTRHVGKGALFYLALGHNSTTWDHPAFRHLVTHGARWLVDQTVPNSPPGE